MNVVFVPDRWQIALASPYFPSRGRIITLTVQMVTAVTGQFGDKPTRGQSTRGLDNSWTGQLTEMFDAKFVKKM